MSREWFMFFNNIYTIVGANQGVIQIINGGTGLSTEPTNGQLLIGDTVNGYVLNTLNPADGITVTNGAGTITLTNTGVLTFSAGTTGLTPAAATNGDVVIGGLLNVASGGTGQSSYVDGELLIGNSTGNTLTKTTLTAGTGITITNGAGSITPSITATGVVAAAYGSASKVGTFTVNAQGQLTSAADVSIAINGNQITSGNVGVLYGGTGQTSYTDGQLLIGNTTGNTLAKSTLTAGTGVTITNGSGTITINSTGLGGTVTSVAATVPSIFSISGSPITTSGTLAMTYSGTALPVANGGTNATSASITAFNNITGYTAAGATGTTSTNLVFSTSPTLITPALGTPSALVGTNITGTASGLTAGNVTTNANLTGPITSVGNATSIASQTGTGTKFVMDTSPTLVTPLLGTPTSGNLANCLGVAKAALPAGTVIQMVQATYSTAVTVVNNSAYNDSGLTATITPISASNKILVIVAQSLEIGRDASYVVALGNIVRTATQVYEARVLRLVAGLAGGAEGIVGANISMVYLDSPATTSATTYKTQFKSDTTTNATLWRAQPNSGTSTIILMEVVA
jgi:hypothetical protein